MSRYITFFYSCWLESLFEPLYGCLLLVWCSNCFSSCRFCCPPTYLFLSSCACCAQVSRSRSCKLIIFWKKIIFFLLLFFTWIFLVIHLVTAYNIDNNPSSLLGGSSLLGLLNEGPWQGFFFYNLSFRLAFMPIFVIYNFNIFYAHWLYFMLISFHG